MEEITQIVVRLLVKFLAPPREFVQLKATAHPDSIVRVDVLCLGICLE